MTEFASLFSTLEAPRTGNARRHSRHDILVIAFGVMLCGGQTGADMELFGHAKRELLRSSLKTGKRHPQPRYRFPAPGYAGSRRFPAVVHRLYALGVACHEDQARNRKGPCAEDLALLRKLALNLARLEASKGSMRGKLKRAGWDDGFLISIRSQFTKIHMR